MVNSSTCEFLGFHRLRQGDGGSEDSEDAKARARATAEAALEAQRETIFTLLRKIDTGLGTRFSSMVKAPGKEVLVTVMEVCAH